MTAVKSHRIAVPLVILGALLLGNFAPRGKGGQHFHPSARRDLAGHKECSAKRVRLNQEAPAEGRLRWEEGQFSQEGRDKGRFRCPCPGQAIRGGLLAEHEEGRFGYLFNKVGGRLGPESEVSASERSKTGIPLEEAG